MWEQHICDLSFLSVSLVLVSAVAQLIPLNVCV